MKKALLLAFTILLAPISGIAAEYKEGVHYTVLNQGPASKPEIAEFFSFYCGHCYNFFKSQVPQIKADMPEGVVFKQNHVEFIGREMGTEFSRAFAIANQLGVEGKMEQAIFAAIHDNKQRFTNLNDIRDLFIANGVEGKDFDAVANSFMVNAQMSKMKRATSNAKISGVPALVINGKYLIETKGFKNYDDMLAAAYYLTTMK